MMSSEYGIWDTALYDYAGVYDTAFTLDKADRLLYHETQMTHAMLFTGVDVLDGAARKWRVENSWGTDKGKDGFYTMNDSWFDEYVFEIAARRPCSPPSSRPRWTARRSCCRPGTRWARSPGADPCGSGCSPTAPAPPAWSRRSTCRCRGTRAA